jgi:hypothetical protein
MKQNAVQQNAMKQDDRQQNAMSCNERDPRSRRIDSDRIVKSGVIVSSAERDWSSYDNNDRTNATVSTITFYTPHSQD